MTAAAADPLVALVGNPNCGKTALFNLLTGSRQKIANYAGVTVERKEGRLRTRSGRRLRVLDLPGAYSLRPRTPDEQITCDFVLGRLPGEGRPDVVVAVVDATNLRRHLRLVLALRRLGQPVVVALNMVDLARRRGLPVNASALAAELGLPVVETVGIRAGGAAALLDYLEREHAAPAEAGAPVAEGAASARARGAVLDEAAAVAADMAAVAAEQHEVERILVRLGLDAVPADTPSDRIDRVVLHPVAGPLVLAVVLFSMFQAVYAGAQPFMQAITAAVAQLAQLVGVLLPAGPLQSLIVDGVLAGAGSVLVFLPQIVLLFAFILALEDSGYLPRAAFLLDRLMGGVGLSGRSFIPLLSSFACAVPGILAARTIPAARDRFVTILIAPLMTCSARLPVYALLIGTFVPARSVGPGIGLQGLVLFALYVAGVGGAFAVAWLLKALRGGPALQPLQMELPTYHVPSLRNLAIGLWQRIEVFVRRVGTIILALMVVLWFLSSFPAAPAGYPGPAIEYSLAGRLGALLAVLFRPIGFNWQISIALVPGIAAREVVVGALGTVYSLSATGRDVAGQVAPLIARAWTLPTAYALLAWYVFAPQCLSTLVAARRETASWRTPALMVGYQFALAYVAAGITYHASRALLGVP
ncbi:MAG: ferrous iron transport protein B [Proteobacteria bacterium]|nr:ferrous iron transport protein B [Pseudomonadota bacterium]